MELDFKKYGFVLDRNESNGYKVFTKKIDDKRFVQLSVMGNTVTLSDYDMQFPDQAKMVIASRYQIEKQEQLDFIIYKGRIGYLFR